MKKMLLSGVALAALAVAPALAADLPRKAPVYVAPAPLPFLWTGFYVGVSGGIISQNSKGNDIGDGTGDGLINLGGDQYGISGVGGLFGINAGYNWQFATNWVLGIEADISWTGVNQTFNFNAGSAVGSKLDYLGTVRGRFGYAFDRALLYATGGFAYGRVKNFATFDSSTAYTLATSKTQTGWTAGGGLEYAFSHNWTGRVEVLYVDLGNTEGTAPGNTSSCRFGFKNQYTVGRFGLNYKF